MTKLSTKDKNAADIEALTSQESILGEPWVPIYKTSVGFEAHHFETAMSNLIRQPNINSTVIMRADILKENVYDSQKGDFTFVSKQINEIPEFPTSDKPEDIILHRYLDDVDLKNCPLDQSKIKLQVKNEIIRRIVPRNPFKDHLINQTCLVFTSPPNTAKEDESVLVVYIPHIKTSDEIPFYLPPVYGVGILFSKSSLSIHYLPFDYNQNASSLRNLEHTERPIRIALRLLQTSSKHAHGAQVGYEKRVNHDLVVPKIEFQNRYISLKKKYSSHLVNQWCESTDPKKHVFEDLAIAAFLIEFWRMKYTNKDEFEFRDLGCGNGLLVYILNQEGYKGKGIDARARKSWSIYPKETQDNLLEQIIIPSVLLKPHPAVAKLAPHIKDNGRFFQVPELSSNHQSPDETALGNVPLMSYYSSANLLQSSQVCTTDEFPPNTFIIGNHSDELTCWIPLLGFPFIVIPCCSHALSGAKFRYGPRKQINQTNHKQNKVNQKQSNQKQNQDQKTSTYGALVDHVEDLSKQMGWTVAKEMLRIPSTRNAAIIGTKKVAEASNESHDSMQTRVLDILALEGGAEGWVENTMMLMKKSPRNH